MTLEADFGPREFELSLAETVQLSLVCHVNFPFNRMNIASLVLKNLLRDHAQLARIA